MGYRELLKDMKLADILKLNYFSSVDTDVCKYVIKHLFYVSLNKIKLGNSISLDLLIDKSLEEVQLFGNDIKRMVEDSLGKIPIKMLNEDNLDFFSNISYSVENGIVLPKTGKMIEYIIPKNIYQFSIFQFSHEHLHMLKETNYKEHVNAFVLGEVIPILYELIIFDNNDYLKRELLKVRMDYLYFNKDDFLLADILVNQRYSKIYEWSRTKYGSYLNSFYYAVILYNMYKENQLKILGLVSKVLKHEMTTIEMLEKLNIYGDIKGEVFEKELGNIKKLIK